MNFQSRTIELNGFEVSIVPKQGLKRLYLRYYPQTGTIKVTYNRQQVSETELLRFINAQLIKLAEKIKGADAKQKAMQLDYLQRDELKIWGKRYTLEVIEVERNYHFFIQDGKINFFIPKHCSQKCKERFVVNCLKELFLTKLTELRGKLEEHCKVQAKSYHVKLMKTRWGSCNIVTKSINLNLSLIHKDPICLEYVIIHELVHLYEKHHNRYFYDLLTKFCPDWHAIKVELEAE